MFARRLVLTTSLFALVAAPSLAGAAEPAIDRALAEVLPSAEEDRWMRVPWRTDVLAALDEAARVKKPVFFWVMNGNPLGCA